LSLLRLALQMKLKLLVEFLLQSVSPEKRPDFVQEIVDCLLYTSRCV